MNDIKPFLELAALQDLAIAKIVLDRPGCLSYKREIASLEDLPHAVIYNRGQQVDSFAASKGTGRSSPTRPRARR